MKFDSGMNVVYKNIGVCIIESVEKKNFDGTNDIEYYKLKPITSNTSTYYIPVENSDDKLRSLFTKNEVDSFIDNMTSADEIWVDDSRERRMIFGNILKSDDYQSIIGMIKALYMHQNEKIKNNKHLSSSDEMLLNSAENLMFQEFSVVLGIEQSEVRNYIIQRIEQ